MTLKPRNIFFVIPVDFDIRLMTCSMQLLLYKLRGLMKNQFIQTETTQ